MALRDKVAYALITLGLAFLFTSSRALAQGIDVACRELITSGLREYSIDTQSSSYLNAVFSRYCETSGTAKSSGIGLGVDLVVKGIPASLTGTYSSNEEAMRNFCKTYTGYSEGQSESQRYEERIVQRAYDSFDQCVQLAQSGVIVKHKVRDLNNFDFFVAPGFSRPVTLRGIKVAPNVVCEGQDPSNDSNPVIKFGLSTHVLLAGDKTLNVACTRRGTQKPNGEDVFEEATVTLLTNITPSGNYSAYLPPDSRLPRDLASEVQRTLAELRDSNALLESLVETRNKAILSGRAVVGSLNGNHTPYWVTKAIPFVDNTGAPVEFSQVPRVVVVPVKGKAQAGVSWATTVDNVTTKDFTVRVIQVGHSVEGNHGWNGAVSVDWIADARE